MQPTYPRSLWKLSTLQTLQLLLAQNVVPQVVGRPAPISQLLVIVVPAQNGAGSPVMTAWQFTVLAAGPTTA
ncbi:hypothetical protein PC9H_004406 [Pleurotus ostreatus]|uniref:Uncharacterized protein n=1 Tax=Pleurotus ostreatus TaxID=5322 RepID=A0A8H7A392_PLEOS|nr:uncharacterized protein PC9H_004406 [Pleurotus ostreatus]KAF7437564.1 hypothetical protein PC9H_004406 [Pleurotus ostreatus]